MTAILITQSVALLILLIVEISLMAKLYELERKLHDMDSIIVDIIQEQLILTLKIANKLNDTEEYEDDPD